MLERTEYAVVRFLNQNGYCHMVNDCVTGNSVMQYVRDEVKVTKQQMFKWLVQMAHQMEQFYRCEEEKAYGYVNPYAVIVTDGNEVLLLDIQETENEELVKWMQKKKVRMLFVRKEYVLSQRTEREDDWFGFGRMIEFMIDKCCIDTKFTRKEERILRRISRKCQKGENEGVKGWLGVQKDLRVLAESVEKEKEPIRKRVLGIAAVTILLLAGVSAFRQGDKETKGVEISVQAEEKKEEQTEKEQNSDREDRAYLELGLMYFVELEDYQKSIENLERVSAETPLAADYLRIIQYQQEEHTGNLMKYELEQALRDGKTKLEEKQKEVIGKECLYKMPFLYGYAMLDTQSGWQEVKRIGEEMESASVWRDWGKEERKETEVRTYLARAYESLEETENAMEEYEILMELENDADELEEIYLRLETLYDELGEAEKAWDVCKRSVEELPESEALWITYIRRHLEDSSIEETVCEEAVKKAVQAVPELEENEEFVELKEEYGIEIEKEEITS